MINSGFISNKHPRDSGHKVSPYINSEGIVKGKKKDVKKFEISVFFTYDVV
jgi:hypothetical protein